MPLNPASHSMKLELIMWSKKPVGLNMTVFTTLTSDRLNILKDQCLSYKGPLSAAVHFGLVQTEDEGKDKLTDKNQAKLDELIGAVKEFMDK